MISSYKEEYVIDEEGNYDEFLDSDYYDSCKYEADKVLSSKDYVLVEGFNQRWNGASSVDLIIGEDNLSDIFNRYMKLDTVEIEVYSNRVEVVNIHHDGRNNYTFTPINLMELSKSALLEHIDEDTYKYETNKNPKYASKEDLCNWIEEYMI